MCLTLEKLREVKRMVDSMPPPARFVRVNPKFWRAVRDGFSVPYVRRPTEALWNGLPVRLDKRVKNVKVVY